MNVYATKAYDEVKGWVCLVLTEGGSIVYCNTYPKELEKLCEHEMVEKTKATLNTLYGEVGLVNSYKIHVVEPGDGIMNKLITLYEKKELRKTKFLFRIINKIDKWFTMFCFKHFQKA